LNRKQTSSEVKRERQRAVTARKTRGWHRAGASMNSDGQTTCDRKGKKGGVNVVDEKTKQRKKRKCYPIVN